MDKQVHQFLILFMGAALAIVLGNSLYDTVLSLTDNILAPALIKIFTWLGVDTTSWDYRNFKVIKFLGDFFVFLLIVTVSYSMYVYMRKNNIRILPNP